MNHFLPYPAVLFQYVMLHLLLIDLNSGNPYIRKEVLGNDEGEYVRIISPEPRSTINWEASLPYRLAVFDSAENDVSNEITPTDVTLEIEFIPLDGKPNVQLNNHPGLKLLSRHNCFGCHADKDPMIGPSFEQISAKSRQSEQLVQSIVNGSVDKWGDYEMPAYQHIADEDARNIVDYIIKQGHEKHRWVYSGLQGLQNLRPKPEGDPSGKLLLTANYGDRSHAIALTIK